MEEYTKFLEDKFHKEAKPNSEGNLQIWLTLKSKRRIEITHEVEGWPGEEDWYYSVRLHCNKEESELDLYATTEGVVEVFTVTDLDSASTALSMIEEMYNEEVVSERGTTF